MEKSAADQAHQNGKERVEDLTAEERKEMDILKDLPSYNSTNFSRLLPQSSSSNGFPSTKNNNSVSARECVYRNRWHGAVPVKVSARLERVDAVSAQSGCRSTADVFMMFPGFSSIPNIKFVDL